MKNVIKALMLLFIVAFSICVTGCGKDKNDDEPENPLTGSTKGEWYVSPGGFATASDFEEIIKAIDNHELLSDYGKYGKHYAEIDEFFYDNGMYTDSDANKGRLRFWVQHCTLAILHIIDDMTAEFYVAGLYKDCGKYNSEGEQRIWHFNAGAYFNDMAYYVGSPMNLIYTKQNNTYVFSNGDIFVKESEGLQGNDGIWKKFTPNY